MSNYLLSNRMHQPIKYKGQLNEKDEVLCTGCGTGDPCEFDVQKMQENQGTVRDIDEDYGEHDIRFIEGTGWVIACH